MNIILGKDDWLFLDNDSNNVIEQVTGKRKLSHKILEKWSQELQRRVEHANKHKYIYKYIIFPNKHCVYDKFLPDNINISLERPAIQLLNIFKDIFIYPLEILKNENKNILYYKTDTHINELGIITVFNYISKLFNSKIFNNFNIFTDEIIGDLGEKIEPKRKSITPKIKFQSESTLIYNNNIINVGGILVIKNKNCYLPRICIFGDSFIRNHLSIIAEYFSEVYFFHGRVFDIEIIEKIKPDIVINANVERFIYSPNIDTNTNTFKKILYNKIFSKSHPQKLITRIKDYKQDEIYKFIDDSLITKYIDMIKNIKDEQIFYNIREKFISNYRSSFLEFNLEISNNNFDKNKEFFIIDSYNIEKVYTSIYGFAITEEGIIDNDSLSKINKLTLNGNGVYIYIYSNHNLIEIFQDFCGSYGIYLYKNNNYFAISNSLLYLIEYLNNNFSLTINKDYINHFQIVDLSSELSSATMINEISIIDRDVKIIIDKKLCNIKFEKINYEYYKYNINSKKGIEIIDQWFTRWSKIIYQLYKQGRNLNFDLSGGFDSRIIFVLALKSGIDLNKVCVHSINDKLHCHIEDYEIASDIAKHFNFKLNQKLPQIEYDKYSLEDIVNICLYGKITLHKQMYYRNIKFRKKIFSITGANGETFRSYMEYEPSYYIKIRKNKALNSFSKNVSDEIIDSIDKLYIYEFLNTQKKYNSNDKFFIDLPKLHYLDTRNRNHFGKAAIENFFANIYCLQPFQDPELKKLKLSTNECSDNNLLFTVILQRFCPDLLKFKVQGGRSFNDETILYAKEINKRYKININKILSNVNNKFNNIIDNSCLKDNENRIQCSEVDSFFMRVFSSKKVFQGFSDIFNEEIYYRAKKVAEQTIFFPLQHCYSIVATVLIKDIINKCFTIKNKSFFSILQNYIDND